MDIQIDHYQLLQLADHEGNERCGFIVGTKNAVTDIWAIPSLRPDPCSYRIGKPAWNGARERAQRESVILHGSIHSHPNGPKGPSVCDLWLSARLHHGALRMVWHPRSGTLTTYGKQGIIDQCQTKRPLWFRLIALVFWY